MKNQTEPRIVKDISNIGGYNINLYFSGADWLDGRGLLDTRVSINGDTLCFITWNDRENFVKELNEVIEKYRI